MSEQEKLNRLFDALRAEFTRCTFPNGREAYMREFEAKFETSVNNMKVGGIDRTAQSYWKTNLS